MNRRRWIAGMAGGLGALGGGAIWVREAWWPKRVREVEVGRIWRGAWQEPGVLGRLIRRHGIRTVVTLTAINRDDPKYVAQAGVVASEGVAWVIVPMRGSTATLEQLREASDLLADARRQPVFFHCVGGHHRSNLAQGAYRIRHAGWTARQAWEELRALPWTDAWRDQADRELLERFEARERGGPSLAWQEARSR